MRSGTGDTFASLSDSHEGKRGMATHARRSRTPSRTPLLLSQKASVLTCPPLTPCWLVPSPNLERPVAAVRTIAFVLPRPYVTRLRWRLKSRAIALARSCGAARADPGVPRQSPGSAPPPGSLATGDVEGRCDTRARALLCAELEHEPAVMLASFQLTSALKQAIAAPAQRYLRRSAIVLAAVRAPAARPAAVDDRARLPSAQRRARPRSLRRPLIPRLVSPHRAGHHLPRVPHPGAHRPKSPAAGLTLPQAVRLFMPIFDCWTGHCHTCHRPINLADLPLPNTPEE